MNHEIKNNLPEIHLHAGREVNVFLKEHKKICQEISQDFQSLEKRIEAVETQNLLFTKIIFFLLQETFKTEDRTKGLFRRLDNQFKKDEEEIKEFIKKGYSKLVDNFRKMV